MPNHLSVRRLIEQEAPSTPTCFRSRESWLSFLATAAECNERSERVIRRVDLGKHSGNRRTFFAIVEPITVHCHDCTPEHRDRMRALARCRPPVQLDETQYHEGETYEKDAIPLR